MSEAMIPNMNNVHIVGAGMIPVGEHWDRSLRELALQAITAALQDAASLEPQAMYVANMLAPALSRQSQLGALLADFAGLRGIESVAVEAAGASGGAALRQAYLALSSGHLQTAIVVGVEKITERVNAEVQSALITSGDADYESVHGVTMTAQAAMVMKRYMHEYKVPRDAFAGFSLTAHANAVANPNAMFRRAIDAEAYSRAGMISDPLNMYDAAPMADGAAAVLLAREDVLPDRLLHPPIQIVASSAAVHAVALHDRPDPLKIDAAETSARRAYTLAGISPEAIDLFELHDLFSINAALSLEAAGFAPPGGGWKLAADGNITREGRIPICTFGGSKARGDAGGATGVYQVCEATLQLQGRAQENQVPEAGTAMTQCLGGSGATAVTHILMAPKL
jgi:acetyl-CoA C-acetyltransferase